MILSLSNKEKKLLKRIISIGDWRNAYHLDIELEDLYSLRKRQLVKSKKGQGFVNEPYFCRLWAITPKGIKYFWRGKDVKKKKKRKITKKKKSYRKSSR